MERMVPATLRDAVAVYDLTEKQLGALGLEYADGRWWTYEEREAEAAKSPRSSRASSDSSPDLLEGLVDAASPGGLTTPASAPGRAQTWSSVAAGAVLGSAAAPGAAETPLAGAQIPRHNSVDDGEVAARELLQAAATSLGLVMSDKALGKLALAGFDDGDALLGLRLGGPAMYGEIMADLEGAPLNAAERVKLKAFMGVGLVEAPGGAAAPATARPPAAAPLVGAARVPVPMRVIDVLEVEDDEDEEDDDLPPLEPAPRRVAPALTPAR